MHVLIHLYAFVWQVADDVCFPTILFRDKTINSNVYDMIHTAHERCMQSRKHLSLTCWIVIITYYRYQSNVSMSAVCSANCISDIH